VSSSAFKHTPYQDFSREAFFFRSQLGQYAACLLLSNWIRAVSGMIDINWVKAGGVKAGEQNCLNRGYGDGDSTGLVGTACIAQGIVYRLRSSAGRLLNFAFA